MGTKHNEGRITSNNSWREKRGVTHFYAKSCPETSVKKHIIGWGKNQVAMTVGGTREEPGSGAQGEDGELMGTNDTDGFGDRGGATATSTQGRTKVTED